MPTEAHRTESALYMRTDFAFHVNENRGRTDVHDTDGDNANHGVDEEGDNAVERVGLDACGQVFCNARNQVSNKVAYRVCY